MLRKKDKNKETFELAEREYLKNLGISCSDDLSEYEANIDSYKKIDVKLVENVDSAMQIIPNILIGTTYGKDTYRVIYNKGLGFFRRQQINRECIEGI